MPLARRESSRPRRLVPAVLVAAALAGCFADPTEVVVVVDTDAAPLRDFSQITFSFSTPDGAMQGAFANVPPLPATIGVVPQGTETEFTVSVNLEVTPTFGPVPTGMAAPNPFASRQASDVSFVKGSMRVLFLPIPKVCACTLPSGAPSTNCPHALDPECLDLVAPSLPALDADAIPHLPRAAP